MHKIIGDYKSPGEFAKEYTGKHTHRQGVNRSYIGRLIRQEIVNPGSTGIDVLEIGGLHFVKYSEPIVNVKPIEEETADILQSIMSKI
jgi:hypothetical protein